MIDSNTKTLRAKGVFIVKNDRGLHTRPSTEIVKYASSFKADVTLIYQKKEVNAKSILGVLMLAAGRGSKIHIVAMGSDAQEAVDGLLDLAARNFNMHY